MQITAENVALVLMVLAITYLLWMPATWLLMGMITPRVLMERYFKQPHFTLGETIMLAQFPGSLIRTMIFCAMILSPKRGKQRQMTDIREYTPQWFLITARLFILFHFGQGFLIVGLLIGLLIYTAMVDYEQTSACLQVLGMV